jgi:peptidoglycan/LPS O-acetylase OafA/YrhL
MQHTSHDKIIPSLNGWRAIAVSLVVIGHISTGYLNIPAGLGVTIFFFLSGFLITRLLLVEFSRDNSINIAHFYGRRVLRICPPLTLVLVVTYALTSLGLFVGVASIKGFLAQFFYFANYYSLFFGPDNQIPSGTAVFWSLAVEEHFYLVFPGLLLIMLRRMRPIQISLLLLVVCALILAWRYYLTASPGFDPNRTYYATDTRIDSILFGCILATSWDEINARWKHFEGNPAKFGLLFLGCILLAVSLVVRDARFRETIRYSIQGIALMPLFLYSIKNYDGPVFSALNWNVLNRIGIYSYSIYLSHEIIFDNISQQFQSRLLAAAATIVLSVMFAYFVDISIDRYFRQLRSRLR